MSYMLSHFQDHIMYDIIYDIILYLSYIISPLPSTRDHAAALAGAYFSPAIRTDHDSDSDRVMDSDEERDFADQGPPPDFESEEDTQILTTLLKHIPAFRDAADIELLLQVSARHSSAAACGDPCQDYARGRTGKRMVTTGRGCCQRLLPERTHP
jgi:hypothetical protein